MHNSKKPQKPSPSRRPENQAKSPNTYSEVYVIDRDLQKENQKIDKEIHSAVYEYLLKKNYKETL